jgi:hypothetical protein
MQDGIDLTPRKRIRDGIRQARGLDHAIDDCGEERHAGRGNIAGAVLASKVEERGQALGNVLAQQCSKVGAVAMRAMHVRKADVTGGGRSMRADGESRQPGEPRALGMPHKRACCIGAGQYNPGVSALGDLDCQRFHVQHGRFERVVPTLAQRVRGAGSIG